MNSFRYSFWAISKFFFRSARSFPAANATVALMDSPGFIVKGPVVTNIVQFVGPGCLPSAVRLKSSKWVFGP